MSYKPRQELGARRFLFLLCQVPLQSRAEGLLPAGSRKGPGLQLREVGPEVGVMQPLSLTATSGRSEESEYLRTDL